MMIVAVSGTPGTGKSSVSSLLAKELGWKLVDLNGLAKETGCCAGFDEKRKCDIVDTEKLESVVKKLEGDMVLDSHYAHEMPADRIFILRTDPKELRKRLVGKGWTENKVMENLQAEIMGVCSEESMELKKRFTEIDTTGRKPCQVVRKIIKSLGLKIK